MPEKLRNISWWIFWKVSRIKGAFQHPLKAYTNGAIHGPEMHSKTRPHTTPMCSMLLIYEVSSIFLCSSLVHCDCFLRQSETSCVPKVQQSMRRRGTRDFVAVPTSSQTASR